MDGREREERERRGETIHTHAQRETSTLLPPPH